MPASYAPGVTPAAQAARAPLQARPSATDKFYSLVSMSQLHIPGRLILQAGRASRIGGFFKACPILDRNVGRSCIWLDHGECSLCETCARLSAHSLMGVRGGEHVVRTVLHRPPIDLQWGREMTQWERATGTSKGTPQVIAEQPLQDLGINSYRRLSCSPPTWKRCREFAEAAVEVDGY